MSTLTFVAMVGPTEPEARDAAEHARLVFEHIGAILHLALLDEAMAAATPPVRATRRDAATVEDVAASATRAQ